MPGRFSIVAHDVDAPAVTIDVDFHRNSRVCREILVARKAEAAPPARSAAEIGPAETFGRQPNHLLRTRVAQVSKGAVSSDGPEQPERVQLNKGLVGFLTHSGYAHGGNGYEGIAFLLAQFRDSGLKDPTDPGHGIDLTAQTVSQMVDQVLKLPEGTAAVLLAPVLNERKGEHHELLEDLAGQGFVRDRTFNAEVRQSLERLLATAMPTDSTSPARPGSVSTACPLTLGTGT